jgi:hypothetical protein
VVIISPAPNGDLAFTRKPPGDDHLVSTNFDVTHPEHGYGYPCRRYKAAQGMLSQLVDRSGALTVQDAADVFDAVHQEGGTSWTRQSLVADLPNDTIYLYYFCQFDRPVVLKVADELAHPRAARPLSALFPSDVQQEAARRYQRIQANLNRCRWGGMTWVAAVLTSMALLIALSLGHGREAEGYRDTRFWMPVVIFLGLLGFLVWLIAGRDWHPPVWRGILLEVVGDAMPTIVAFLAFSALAIPSPTILGSELAQLVLIIGLPLASS